MFDDDDQDDFATDSGDEAMHDAELDDHYNMTVFGPVLYAGSSPRPTNEVPAWALPDLKPTKAPHLFVVLNHKETA